MHALHEKTPLLFAINVSKLHYINWVASSNFTEEIDLQTQNAVSFARIGFLFAFNLLQYKRCKLVLFICRLYL